MANFTASQFSSLQAKASDVFQEIYRSIGEVMEACQKMGSIVQSEDSELGSRWTGLSGTLSRPLSNIAGTFDLINQLMNDYSTKTLANEEEAVQELRDIDNEIASLSSQSDQLIDLSSAIDATAAASGITRNEIYKISGSDDLINAKPMIYDTQNDIYKIDDKDALISPKSMIDSGDDGVSSSKTKGKSTAVSSKGKTTMIDSGDDGVSSSGNDIPAGRPYKVDGPKDNVTDLNGNVGLGEPEPYKISEQDAKVKTTAVSSKGKTTMIDSGDDGVSSSGNDIPAGRPYKVDGPKTNVKVDNGGVYGTPEPYYVGDNSYSPMIDYVNVDDSVFNPNQVVKGYVVSPGGSDNYGSYSKTDPYIPESLR